ncbi:MAG: sulfatase [Candidatus Helarchaeota archaeon]
MRNKVRQNLILITIDTLRIDHLSIMGYEKKTSPYLDKLAKKGIFFKQVITNGPWTLPSFSSIFTSIYPFHQGGYSPLPENKTTIAEVLQSNNYLTIGIHSTPVLSKFYGFDRGFEIYHGAITKSNGYPIKNKVMNKFLNNMMFFNKFADSFLNIKIFKKLQYQFLILFYNIIVGDIEYYKDADVIFKKAFKILQDYYSDSKKQKKPFFLWIHLMDLHDPYFPKSWTLKKIKAKNITDREIEYLQKHPEYLSILREYKSTKKIMDLYDSELRYVDTKIKRFFQKLKSRNWLKNTLTIITSDHGEEFNERGKYGHNAQLHDELLKVPLIMISNELKRIKKERKTDINNIVNMLDLAPTILDLLGLPKEPNFDGTSFSHLIYFNDCKIDTPDPIEYGIFSGTYHKNGNICFSYNKNSSRIISYRTKKWKYIIDENGLVEKLYDLENDPKEKNNIINELPKISRILKRKIINHLHENDIRQKNIKDIIEKKKVLYAIRKLRI